MEEVPQKAPRPLGQLPTDEVERLDAVRAFVDLADPRVAHQLLHAVLADIAVAAMDLDREIGRLEAVIGEEGLDDRGHQLDQLVGVSAHLRIGMAAGDVELERDPVGQRPGALVEGSGIQQHPPDIGMDDDRIGGSLRIGGAPQRAPLAAFPARRKRRSDKRSRRARGPAARPRAGRRSSW